MATRKRATRRPAKKSNSKISEAQKSARETLSGQGEADRKARLAALAKKNDTKLEPRTGTPMANSGRGLDQDKIAERDIGTAASQAAQKIAGLAMGLQKSKQDRSIKAQAAGRPKDPLSNPALYGQSSTKQRAQNLSDRLIALNASVQQQKQKGNAVYMGLDPKNSRTVKIRNQGPERMNDDGSTTTEEKVGDLVLTKDELMSWLTDEAKVAEIKAAAQKAGLAVDSYDDVAKLWTSVVSQAASSYSIADKKVTPWALLTLRGKYMGADGKPKDRTVTSTSIDEMDPATARLMFEKTAQAQLGRAPTKQEVDDFIAKAQTIALKNPAVTTTTQRLGFDGNVESQVSRTRGGAQAVSDQAEVAAMDQARQSEDYAAYQAAGNYFPALFEALGSPV